MESRKGHQTAALFPGRRSVRRLMEVLLGPSFNHSGPLGYADADGVSHRRPLRRLDVFQRRRGGSAFGLGVGRAPVAIQSRASLVTSPVPQPLCFLRQNPVRCGLKKRMGPQELGQKAIGATCNLRQSGSDVGCDLMEAGLAVGLVKCRMSRVDPVALFKNPGGWD
jgi:hypothetical protein